MERYSTFLILLTVVGLINVGFFLITKKLKSLKVDERNVEVDITNPYQVAYFFYDMKEVTRLALYSLFRQNLLRFNRSKNFFGLLKADFPEERDSEFEKAVFNFCLKVSYSRLRKSRRPLVHANLEVKHVLVASKLNQTIKELLTPFENRLIENQFGYSDKTVDDFYFLRFIAIMMIWALTLVTGIFYSETFLMFVLFLLIAVVGSLLPSNTKAPGLTKKGEEFKKKLGAKYNRINPKESLDAELYKAAVQCKKFYYNNRCRFLFYE